jgi:hypothetical protein
MTMEETLLAAFIEYQARLDKAPDDTYLEDEEHIRLLVNILREGNRAKIRSLGAVLSALNASTATIG